MFNPSVPPPPSSCSDTLANSPAESERRWLGLTRETWLWILIPVVSFAWFWYWRSIQWSGGDSEQWEREINFGVWWRKRQMFSFACMQMMFQITHRLWGWNALMAINATSCLAGSLTLLTVWRLFRGRPHAAWSFALVATAGFTTLFYGHIETYAQPVAALCFHLLAVERTLAGKWKPWTMVLSWCLIMAFHLSAIFILPAMLPLALLEIHRQKLGWSELREVLKAAVPGALFWFAINGFLDWGYGELAGPHFICPLDQLLSEPWVVFTDEHLKVKFWFLVWDGGVAGFLAYGLFARELFPGRRDRFTLYLLAYFLCYMGFYAIWNPEMGERDFDLFSFPWVIAVVAVARHVMTWRGRAVWVGLILGFNLYLWATRPVVSAEREHQGNGIVLFENKGIPDGRPVMLDERMFLRPLNPCVPEGTHLVTAFFKRGRVDRVLNIRPHDVWLVRGENGDIQILRPEWDRLRGPDRESPDRLLPDLGKDPFPFFHLSGFSRYPKPKNGIL
ncbi:MAG TPA: hypothetical protein PKH31_15680 [Candidatus Sumerlaeota bacterium]|nr:hypothetical protein [Candidatus Sumerlaeota bacterium]